MYVVSPSRPIKEGDVTAKFEQNNRFRHANVLAVLLSYGGVPQPVRKIARKDLVVHLGVRINQTTWDLAHQRTTPRFARNVLITQSGI